MANGWASALGGVSGVSSCDASSTEKELCRVRVSTSGVRKALEQAAYIGTTAYRSAKLVSDGFCITKPGVWEIYCNEEDDDEHIAFEESSGIA